MTKTSARMELHRLLDLNASPKFPLAIDVDAMIVFLPDEEAHCDHVFWRGFVSSLFLNCALGFHFFMWHVFGDLLIRMGVQPSFPIKMKPFAD